MATQHVKNASETGRGAPRNLAGARASLRWAGLFLRKIPNVRKRETHDKRLKLERFRAAARGGSSAEASRAVLDYVRFAHDRGCSHCTGLAAGYSARAPA